MVAQLASRGFETAVIAEEVRLTPNRVRQILRTEEVISEISRLAAERFEEGDRLLPTLYQEALAKLGQHLDSPNVEVQARAIDRVLKFYEPKDERGRPLVAQFFAGVHESQEEREESLDEIILRKRQERGLPND
jgi:predicted transcriptional regulator